MTVLYVDTSVVVRAYLPDEPHHRELKALLFDSANPVVTSELTRVEFASAISAAARADRMRDPNGYLEQFDEDCAEAGPLALIQFDAAVALPFARTAVTQHRLRTLDAIHLAVLATDGVLFAGEDDIALVTRDDDQANAARAMGIPVLY